MENFNATIDQSKCTGCGICAEKCPKKVIVVPGKVSVRAAAAQAAASH